MSTSRSHPQEIIEISDSEEPGSNPPPSKRRKVSQDSQSNAMTNATLAAKNNHLKGRKRFKADLEDMKEACKTGFIVKDLKVTKIRPGDDEGSFEVFVSTTKGEDIVMFNLFIPEPTDYPKDHTCFASTEGDHPSNIQDVISDISSISPRTISETITNTLSSLSKAMDTGDAAALGSDAEDDEEDYEDPYMDDNYDDEFAAQGSTTSKINLSHMQTDFIDTVASLYRPGLIRFGHDDFCISVSLPVVQLAESIPPRALMAWDRRLLSRSQHLVLLISDFRGVYPSPDFTAEGFKKQSGASQPSLTFKVGLSGRYKPGKEQAREVHRKHGLIIEDAEDALRAQKEKEKADALAAVYEWDGEGEDPMLNLELMQPEEEEEVEDDDEERFDRFSMSSSLESLLDQYFLKLVNIRRKYGVGWAGAELILLEAEKNQSAEDVVAQMMATKIRAADKEEAGVAQIKGLPHDPLAGLSPEADVNVPLTAFSYLIRRLSLCTRYCTVCHSKLDTDYEALKPYVCGSKLCTYQYYALNRGPSVEYEIIHNPKMVDLLVSFAHSSASEGVLKDSFPVGLGLLVPLPDTSKVLDAPVGAGALMAYPAQPQPQTPSIPLNSDNLLDFDKLNEKQMRASIVQLLDSLPAVDVMRKHLLRKTGVGKSKPKLAESDSTVLPAAWLLLRWVIGSCTAYLEEITDPNDRVQHIDSSWRQYRFSVGAPDAEAKFGAALEEAKRADANCHKFPSLFAFHGSPLRNWHSIVRHGLWFKDVAHGRAYGHGVYMAKDGALSLGSYTGSSRSPGWRKTKLGPTHCAALVETVNRPDQFVSQHPYFVVQHTHWLMCRYLLVKTSTPESSTSSTAQTDSNANHSPFFNMDPKHPIIMNQKAIGIPEPGYKLDLLMQKRRGESNQQEHEPDESDQEVFSYVEDSSQADKGKANHFDYDSDIEMIDSFTPTSNQATSTSSSNKPKKQARPADDWVHDAEYVNEAAKLLTPPPTYATPSATMAVQRELRSMMKEQDACSSFKELGWYMPPELNEDNLFQWVVEMHSFDPDLPIAQDMAREKVNSVIFEIRFPEDFPLAPPFFRIITPRFLPFIQGGGGHVTGGGSICMDLLTTSGWLPSYSIAAILIQIKLAISNPDPRPARLLGGDGWKRPYQVQEALEGYRRAAATHKWPVSAGLDKLFR